MSGARPELQLIPLLRSLRDHQIEHVVFGAIALSFYGHVRGTADLDVIVRPGETHLSRVYDWLVDLDAHLVSTPSRRFGARERWKMFKGQNATLLTNLGQVDVVQDLPGLPAWDDLIANSEQYEFDGLLIHVMNRATLIALKRRRASAQDIADIEAIERL